MKRYATTIGLLFSVVLASRGDFIYDVDFEPPTFTDGAPITTGPGPDTPSFALGVVDANLGSFSSQAAFLNNGGQMRFDAPVGMFSSGMHSISFDAAMIDVAGIDNMAGFSINDISDGTIAGVIFDNGTVRVGSPGNYAALSYTVGTPDKFLFLIDLDAYVYSAWVDGSPVLEDIAFGSMLDLTEVRANTGSPNPSVSMGVDNFRWQLIPEPSTLALLVMGLGGLLLRRKATR